MACLVLAIAFPLAIPARPDVWLRNVLSQAAILIASAGLLIAPSPRIGKTDFMAFGQAKIRSDFAPASCTCLLPQSYLARTTCQMFLIEAAPLSLDGQGTPSA